MKLPLPKRLFWFLKTGSQLDTGDPAQLDMYVQQVLTKGTTKDVTNLLGTIPAHAFSASFERIAHFLPPEVRSFWKTLHENHH